MSQPDYLFYEADGNLEVVQGKTIAVLGYGNQGRSQALNMRDSGLSVIIGNRADAYFEKAQKDGFEVMPIAEAVPRAEILFILLPDEDTIDIFAEHITPNLNSGQTLVFASGYNLGFNLLKLTADIDILLIAPRMIGVGVRERYLTKEGFFSFISIHQDASGNAKITLLGLTKAVGGLKTAVMMSFKDEAILDLFDEQAFGPAFGRVLLDSIEVLIQNGLPPEAALIEMYISEEMAYTYRKMAQIGLVKQTNFHSHTSQYGAMSHGMRYMGLGLKKIMQKTYDEIASGKFAKEWQKPSARVKFKIIKYFAMRQKINRIEEEVRKNLHLKSWDIDTTPDEIEELLNASENHEEIEKLKQFFEIEDN